MKNLVLVLVLAFSVGCGGKSRAAPPDVTAPGAVTNLAAALQAVFGVDLTWTSPADADLMGILVVRAPGGQVPGILVDGTDYPVGQAAGGGDVVFSGTGQAYSDQAPPLGSVQYRVYAYDEVPNYSSIAVVTIDVPEPVQLGTLEVDLVNDTVTVTSQPFHITLSGSAFYDAGMQELTVSLDVQNDFPRILFNTKAAVTGVNEGTATGDGTFDGDAYVYYGPEALDIAATRSRDIVFTGVTGAVDPIVVDVEIVNHAMLFIGADWQEGVAAVDSAGTGQEQLTGDPLGYRASDGADSAFTAGCVSPDGRFLYVGNRNQPMVTTIDTLTMTPVAGVDLMGGSIQFDGTGSIGHVDSVTMSPDTAHLYAVLTKNQHSFAGNIPSSDANGDGGPPEIEVVKIDRATMLELGRVTLIAAGGADPDNNARGRQLSISADGRCGALGVLWEGLVFVLDLNTMTIIDGDPGTAGDQGFDVSGTSLLPRHAAISPDGSTVYVTYRGDPRNGEPNDGTLDVLDVASGNVTPLAPPTVSTGGNNNPSMLGFGPDGRLYYVREDVQEATVGLSIYDPAGLSWMELLVGQGARGLTFGDGVYYVYDRGQSEVTIFDIATDAVIPTAADASGSIATSGPDFTPVMIVTPR